MILFKKVLPALVLFCTPLGGFCQTDESSMDSLLEQAIVIRINTRLLSANGKASWNFSVARVTIPGRPVVVKLQGGNLQIRLGITPYTDDTVENGMILVTQDEIWITETPGKQAKYLASLKSVKLVMGETIHLYPLGVSTMPPEKFNIELEIQIIPYKDTIKTPQNEQKSPKEE
jgi:hypothetical protein